MAKSLVNRVVKQTTEYNRKSNNKASFEKIDTDEIFLDKKNLIVLLI